MNWYRGVIQGKTRILLAWMGAILLGFCAREYPQLPGIGLSFLGATLRFWASGYLRKDKKPAVGGPYAFVRNPLYLGTYLMVLGIAWAIQNWLLLGILTVLFAGIYHFIILDEETKLRRFFQSSYLDYCQNVPRFFPRAWPPFFPARKEVLYEVNPDPTQHRFSWALAITNKAYEAYVSFFGLVLLASFIAFLWNKT